MSSLIPKISIGVDTKREKFDLSSLTHTTSEIGYVQPTFSKLIVPNSKVRIGTRTGSRLSPLFVPTMGQIDIRHYHCFVPFSTLWTPFDAFITKTNYTLPTGETYLPTQTPYFRVHNLFNAIFGINADSVNYGLDDLQKCLTCRIYKDGTNEPVDVNHEFNSGDQTGLAFANTWYSQANPTFLDFGIYNLANGSSIAPYYDNVALALVPGLGWKPIDDISVYENILPSEWSYPTIEACDFSDHFRYNGTNYTIVYNFNGALKRLRTIFMGLGYSFNPYDEQQVTVFKLLAFYKAYWSLFGVNRTFNFFNTYCYKSIKYMSEDVVTSMVSAETCWDLFIRFVTSELINCTYTCPVDYFSASDLNTQRGAGSSPFMQFYSPVTGGDNGELSGTAGARTYISGTSVPVQTNSTGSVVSGSMSPLAQQIAMRLLRFVNKNSVVGRKVSEILRTRYGVSDIHNDTPENVIRVGSSATKLEISPIYNQTDSGALPLGGYAGMCVGGNQSKMFTFETKEFGVLLTLTSVVPKMGYFQGMFHENSDGVNGPFDFYTPEFDALGWQPVRYNELIADRQFHNGSNSSHGTDLGIFGYMPTYSHLKISNNRVLGDVSLPHLQDSMLPYTLDRFFPQRKVTRIYGDNNTPFFTVPSLPVNDPMTFRSGTQGNTNRIFNDFNGTDDHVIMQIFFDVHMTAPMKSIATSFDTYDEESTHSVSVGHE